ncbi:MAG: hypothetical protein QXO67_02360 [Candidatus Bathyarchaeia archaeon]
MGRARRILCGFIGGILIRLAFDMPTFWTKTACVVLAITSIIYGAIPEERLLKWKAERRKELWES